MIQLPTYNELKDLYLAMAQSQYQDVDITQFTDFNAKASGAGGIGARLALDSFRLFNATYPQNGDSFGINSQLAAKGVPSQYAATPTLVTGTAQDLESGKTYEIPVGTNLRSNNGVLYQVISPDGVSLVVQLSTVTPELQLISIEKGTATNIAVGALLTFSPPQFPTDGSDFPISIVEVDTTLAGVNEESLGSTINRLIDIQQIPLNGNRATDIFYIAYDPINGVNDVIVLVNNQLQYASGNINTGVFDVGGTPITDLILNKGLVVGTTTEVFNRSVSSGIYNQTQADIVAENICGLFSTTNTVATQALTALSDELTPFFKIQVILQSGYALNSIVQVGGINFTITQLIQREVRRAICGQPFGAVLSRNYTTGTILSSSIATSSIEQQLDESLGTPTTIGSLGNYLSSRSVLVYNGVDAWEYQATIPLSLGIPTTTGNPISWVYDISATAADIYPNIGVELAS